MMDSDQARYSDLESGSNQEARRSSSTSICSTTTNSISQSFAFPHCYYNNSLAIRHEIQRFESVHPSIYAIYDLLELIGGTDGQLIAQRMRELIVCIEDSFVNSQEWTLSRAVPDLRLGIVGTIESGKSSLVHRYLTGTYLQDESPEGGRFKKEVKVDNESYLLLIRDEGGPPEMQLSCWVDAVLFVFSLDDESSFNALFNYYTRMFHLRSNDDIPIFLIGTQDSISERNPRVIDESRARKLANEMKHCTYYETCAAYGLNVEKIFKEACQKIVNMRNSENNLSTIGQSNNSWSSTPNQSGIYRSIATTADHTPVTTPTTTAPTGTPLSNITNSNNKYWHLESINQTDASSDHCSLPNVTSEQFANNSCSEQNLRSSFLKCDTFNTSPQKNLISTASTSIVTNTPKYRNKPAIAAKPKLPAAVDIKKINPPAPIAPKRSDSIKHCVSNQFKTPIVSALENVITYREPPKEQNNLAQTPNSSRKNRRKSNLFTPLSGKNKNSDDKYKNGEVGVGRAIPIKQGYLYKKSKKTLNKDWKKKYVTLTTDGYLTYHRTLHDYMNDTNGKNIPLKHTTVKIPGQKPRCGRSSIAHSPSNFDANGSVHSTDIKMIPITNLKYEKKRSRKLKNVGNKSNDSGDDSDGNEFMIVSLENKQWHFNANNSDEREDWVCAIEQQILSSLQNLQCDKAKLHNVNSVDDSAIHSIRTVPGNKFCVDCDAPNPDWASLNLGTLICIECSGIHRKLGTHISKVRSLTLDVWPSSHVNVMLGLGNMAANKIWEFNLKSSAMKKPSPSSIHEDKETYIRAKYEGKQFLAPLRNLDVSIEQQIIDSVLKMDLKQLAHVLAHLSLSNINLSMVQGPDKKTPLHLIASRGNLEITQLLIWYNANENAIDAEGKTPLFYARISGHKEIEELLIQSGCVSTSQDPQQAKTKCAPPLADVPNNNDNRNFTKRRENIPLNLRQIEMFNKLPSSII